MPDPRLTVVGLMSGTSADGIDAALVDITGGPRPHIELRAFKTYPYPTALRTRILRACEPGLADNRELAHLDFVLGERFASAAGSIASAANSNVGSVDLIGCHGQTIYHGPRDKPPTTLQLAQPSVIAERTGRTVIAHFRARDVAAGGQGAPLVPTAHRALFHQGRPRAILNLGGIANITVLTRGGAVHSAFDTGPANMVLDGLVRIYSDNRKMYDRFGRMAAQGSPHPGLLKQMLSHPFFRRRPPRSTGREEFGDEFLQTVTMGAAQHGLSPENTLATAVELTVESVARATERFVLGAVPIAEMVLCGGGVHNRYLVARLQTRLQALGISVVPADDLGVASDAVEALAFAYLAYESLMGRPGNAPAATGADGPRILGAITPGDNWAHLTRATLPR